MKSFPVFVRTTGRRVVILGGGEQAAQKARLLLKTDAELVIAAAEIDDELAGLVAAGRAVHHAGPVTEDLLDGAALAFVGTGCAGADAALAALARAARVPVNAVDRPDLCDVTTPSIVDRDPVVVAIGTEGTAPVLGRQIKTRIEEILDPSLGAFAALAGRLRGAVADRVPRPARRGFWHWVFTGPAWDAHKRGAARDAARMLKDAIAAGGAETHRDGLLSLVGAGPGARDLLTLRAVERLQEADVIFYDRLVDPEVLELARRDAERVYVGKEVGANAWPQDRICALIAGEAAKGRRVVRLKSGDPSIFGRAPEELAAAKAAGVAVEIVPGVTAMCAMAAETGRSLTERGVSDTVILTTGQCRDGDPEPDWARHARPGSTLIVYMAGRRLGDLSRRLIAKGVPGDLCVTLGWSISTARSRTETMPLSRISALRSDQLDGPLLFRLDWPKPGQVIDRRQLVVAEAIQAAPLDSGL